MKVLDYFKSLWNSNIVRQILFALFILFVSRLIWFLANQFWLPAVGFTEFLKAFLYGFYFDLPVIAYLFAPLFLWQLALPNFSQKHPAVTKILFLLPNAICLVLNGIDTGFSKINGKRSGFELFSMAGDEGNHIAPYLSDNIPSLLGLIISFYLIYRFTPTAGNATLLWKKNRIFRNLLFTPVLLFGWILAARGGLQLRPIRSIDASNYVDASISPLVYSHPVEHHEHMG